MNRIELENRLIEFTTSVIDLAETLPKNQFGNYYSNQVLRSSSSASLNYGEAQSAESRKDYQHKLQIIIKELRETKISLTIISKRIQGLKNSNELIQENNELLAIFIASLNTSKRKQNV